MKRRLLIGTRASPLALAQTNEVIEALKEVAPMMRFETVPIRTSGDRLHDVGTTAVEGKSLFTKEIEESLLKGQIDVAIHSMKDLTTDLPQGLIIGAVPERANPHDVLISRGKKRFDQLPGRARIGTSSVRRKAQLLAARGDLEIIEMHGNVDTRLRKLERGEYDAIVLAAAGLKRLGLEERAVEFLSTDVILPAVGQGALAIESRGSDDEVNDLLSRVDHKPSHKAVEAERAFARRLGANCRTPIAAYARFEASSLAIDGMVATLDGRKLIRSRIVSNSSNTEEIGKELAESLLSKGAAVVLEIT